MNGRARFERLGPLCPFVFLLLRVSFALFARVGALFITCVDSIASIALHWP